MNEEKREENKQVSEAEVVTPKLEKKDLILSLAVIFSAAIV